LFRIPERVKQLLLHFNVSFYLSRKPLQILGLGLIRPEFFFFENGHGGYLKTPLSIQIPKKSTYLNEKMHPKQDIVKQRWFSLP
jgi:hypothetical protein